MEIVPEKAPIFHIPLTTEDLIGDFRYFEWTISQPLALMEYCCIFGQKIPITEEIYRVLERPLPKMSSINLYFPIGTTNDGGEILVEESYPRKGTISPADIFRFIEGFYNSAFTMNEAAELSPEVLDRVRKGEVIPFKEFLGSAKLKGLTPWKKGYRVELRYM